MKTDAIENAIHHYKIHGIISYNKAKDQLYILKKRLKKLEKGIKNMIKKYDSTDITSKDLKSILAKEEL